MQLNPGYCRCFLLYYSFLFFIYLTLRVKPRLEKSQGVLPPHQTDGNSRNGKPSISVSPSALEGGYRKRMAVDSTVANMGLFHPFSSFFVWTDKDATYLFLTDLP